MDPESAPRAPSTAGFRAKALLACMPDLQRAAQGGESSLAKAAAERFGEAARESGLLINFNWAAWQDKAKQFLEEPGLLNKASLDDISKLLTTCVRKERFVEGHLEEMASSGQLSRLVARLQELAKMTAAGQPWLVMQFVFHPIQRERFRDGSLVTHWRDRYPQLFDLDDERVLATAEQRRYHFLEWLSAVLLYEATGYQSFVEKYSATSHGLKRDRMRTLLPAPLDSWLSANQTGQPDLLVYHPDTKDWYFCEVKGPGDRVRDAQKAWMQRFNACLQDLSISPRGRLRELRLKELRGSDPR